MKNIDYIIAEYKKGKSGLQLAKEMNCHKTTIYRLLKRNNISIRPLKTYLCDIPKFPNEYTEYWLGFILADGCIVERKDAQSQLQIGLSILDKHHLKKCLQWLKLEDKRPIYTSRTHATIHVSSTDLSIFLKDFGITAKKAKIAKVDPRLFSSRHFWRGLVDGDGSIHKRGNSWVVDIGGTKSVCQSFLDFAGSNGIDVSKNNPNKNGESFKSVLQGDKAIKLINILYSNNNISLQRKQLLANEVMKNEE